MVFPPAQSASTGSQAAEQPSPRWLVYTDGRRPHRPEQKSEMSEMTQAAHTSQDRPDSRVP